ncbi:MAG: ATP-binding cassette domain-containing protein, partial [Clostridiaceae bacterium]|nr:ATP-binding cassette domain-containing protein [Clostridiaceae bacterium]
VGLSNRYDSRLKELSGGEQQRVAIAIALSNNPKMILADEPTGSVDSKTAYSLMDTFGRLNSELGVTIVIVTHDSKVSGMVNRVISISDGMIGSETLRSGNYVQKLMELGHHGGNHDEYAVIDRKGRVKIPEEYLEELKLTDGQRVKIRKSIGGIELYKD